MRRTICCAVFALLLSSGSLFSQTRFAPRPVAHPRVRVIGLQRFLWRPPLFIRCPIPAPVAYPIPYSVPDPYPVPPFIPPSPAYAFIGSASVTHPQLMFKDGTTYTVADYWRVDDQLHFITLEEGGTKSVPHTVPFDSLDAQRTKDAAAAQGFRFMIRDEPIEQWLQHRRQHTPGRTELTAPK